jgi:hypothetical protein
MMLVDVSPGVPDWLWAMPGAPKLAAVNRAKGRNAPTNLFIYVSSSVFIANSSEKRLQHFMPEVILRWAQKRIMKSNATQS